MPVSSGPMPNPQPTPVCIIREDVIVALWNSLQAVKVGVGNPLSYGEMRDIERYLGTVARYGSVEELQRALTPVVDEDKPEVSGP